MYNFVKVPFTDELYWGDQPSLSQLNNLDLIGVKSVINMRDKSEKGYVEEDQLMKEKNIEYAHIPVLEAHDIDSTYTKKVEETIEKMQKPVLLHCQVGLCGSLFLKAN